MHANMPAVMHLDFNSAALIICPCEVQVLGLERFSISHANGSHHGLTRITRQAYMEGPQYVPLLRKSFQAYEALQRETKQRLFWQTGVLNIGHQPFEGARATAVDQGLAHEVLTGKQAQQRFPGKQAAACCCFQQLRNLENMHALGALQFSLCKNTHHAYILQLLPFDSCLW
jgi:hypothetical protein